MYESADQHEKEKIGNSLMVYSYKDFFLSMLLLLIINKGVGKEKSVAFVPRAD